MPGLLKYYDHGSLHAEYLKVVYKSDKTISPEKRSDLLKKAQDAFISAINTLATSAPSNNLIVGLSDCNILSTFDYDELHKSIAKCNNYTSEAILSIWADTSFREFAPQQKPLSDHILRLDFTFNQPNTLIARLDPSYNDIKPPNLPIHTHSRVTRCDFCASRQKNLEGKFIDTPKAFTISELLTLFEYVKR